MKKVLNKQCTDCTYRGTKECPFDSSAVEPSRCYKYKKKTLWERIVENFRETPYYWGDFNRNLHTY